MIDLVFAVFAALKDLIHQLGYAGIVLGMTIESSAIPFPSEVVIPPAGALVHEGKMSMPLVILCGGVGSVIGALINYYVAFFLGRPFFERYGKYVLVTEDKIRRSEEFFEKYGAMATFICRFITVIRQLVSLPAGFSKMDIKKFVIYTALGSTLWSAILAYLGYAFGAGEEMIRQYKGPITKGAILAAVVVTVIYAATVIRRKRNASLTS